MFQHENYFLAQPHISNIIRKLGNIDLLEWWFLRLTVDTTFNESFTIFNHYIYEVINEVAEIVDMILQRDNCCH